MEPVEAVLPTAELDEAIGQQTETVTVTAQAEVIQTETGAREGVLNARQIDNLSIIGRSSPPPAATTAS